VHHLADLEPLRRYATLTALVLDLTATLTDEALNMFEHLIGKLFKNSVPSIASISKSTRSCWMKGAWGPERVRLNLSTASSN
jgi:hypothetical protein